MAKKKDAHHGGAWKVAYADFVTAMMALFMVLWISAQDKEILLSTAQYFQNPFNSPLVASSGVMPFDSNKVSKSSGDQTGVGKELNSSKQIELAFLNSLAKDFYKSLRLDETLEDRPIDIQVTSDGLRVNVFNRPKQPIFKGNTAEITEWGQSVIQSLSWMIERNKLKVTIDGHTSSGLTFDKPDYTVWELSSDRANAARRLLTYYAVDDKQIERVAGYGDTTPVAGTAPEDDVNQRVTISLTSGKTSEKDLTTMTRRDPIPTPKSGLLDADPAPASTEETAPPAPQKSGN
jgi:chemotaxis protein MotB